MENKFEPYSGVEVGTGLITFFLGAVAVHSINDNIIAREYLSLSEPIDTLNHQIAKLRRSQTDLSGINKLSPELSATTEGTNRTIDQVLNQKESKINALVEQRSHDHAPYSDPVEMGATVVLALLAVGICTGIRRAINHHRNKMKSRSHPVLDGDFGPFMGMNN